MSYIICNTVSSLWVIMNIQWKYWLCATVAIVAVKVAMLQKYKLQKAYKAL